MDWMLSEMRRGATEDRLLELIFQLACDIEAMRDTPVRFIVPYSTDTGEE